MLPYLHTLKIFGSRSIIRFSTIFACCPSLWELCYDVWNIVGDPQGEQAPSLLLCIRLHSAMMVVRDWVPMEQHFELFLSTEFRRLQRFVMYGSWHSVIADVRVVQERVADVLEDQALGASDDNTFQRTEVEQVGVKKGDIFVVSTIAVIRLPRQHIRATHCMARYKDHRACRRFKFCDFRKYSKFL
ncbi:hypothetical protein B0H19DRAFT_1247395 [Mycena capillaripes]|nr:hypothetical protein B0H19DRAFT_1247395 [Mycena capillaripes]